MDKNKTVVVGMSGGVDSSVAALILKNMGYRVVGLHMKSQNVSLAKEDEEMVKAIANKIGIELVIKDYASEMQKVKDYFICEYKSGRTPNPCVVCNREVKFKPFVEYMNEIGASYFATGHYARISHQNSTVLLKANDKEKDQSYFLNQLSLNQLEHALFPLGELTKDQVRKIAEDNGFINSKKKDSFDVCFVGNKKFKEYMKDVCHETKGNIVDIKTNKILGQHDGLSKYTIGQRRGIGVGGQKEGTGQSWFVLDKDIESNILYVCQGDGEELLSAGLKTGKFNWLYEIKENEFECKAKFRYRQADQDVVVIKNKDNTLEIKFKEPQRAITIGQYVVLYNQDICLGGATIEKVIKEKK